MEHVNIGMVGAGFMGQLAHLRQYDRIDGCSVAALAEPRSTLAQRVAQRYDIPAVYETHVELIRDAEVDALVAAQPYNRYAALVPELYDAGVPLFTEKPAAVRPQTAQELAAMAAEAGVSHMVGYNKRSDPAMEHAQRVMEEWRDSGQFGAFRYVRVTIPEGDWIAGAPAPISTTERPPDADNEPLPADFDDRAAETYDHVINYYIHQINALRFFFGETYDVRYADSSGQLLVAESQSGVSGTIEMSPYCLSSDWQERVLLGFDRGYIRVELPAPLASQAAGRVEILCDGEDGDRQIIQPSLPNRSSMRNQAENFLAVVRGKREPPCSVREAAKDLEVAYDYVNARYT